MRTLPLISLVLAVLTACGTSEQMPQSQEFNKVLDAGATSGPEIFSLSVSAEKRHEKIYLFCRLRNISGQIVRIDEAYLPWNTLGMMKAIAFDAQGKQLRTNLFAGGIYAEGDYHDMAAGQELTGSIDMDHFLYASERPSSGDVGLRWVYLPKLENTSAKQRALSGITLLPEQLR